MDGMLGVHFAFATQLERSLLAAAGEGTATLWAICLRRSKSPGRETT
jgi:hypothetical protein